MPFPNENLTPGFNYVDEYSRTWVYTDKGVWNIVSPEADIDWVISNEAPSNPIPGITYWYNPDTKLLQLYFSDGSVFYWRVLDSAPVISISPPNPAYHGMLWVNPNTDEVALYVEYNNAGFWRIISSQEREDAKLVLEQVLPLSWKYSIDRKSFELLEDSIESYRWRDINPIKVLRGTKNDDSLDTETVDNLKVNGSYVIYKKDVTASPRVLERPVITALLTNNRVRVATDLSYDISELDEVYLSRTSFDIQEDGTAIVRNGDLFFSRPLDALEHWVNGVVVIRRTASGQGQFDVRYRVNGTIPYTKADLIEVLPVDEFWRDEFYEIQSTGIQDIRVEYISSNDVIDKIDHLVLYCKPISESVLRVEKPYNKTPSNGEVNVSSTPTLTGSTYHSLYAIAQGGAEFQVARDENFSDLVINTSTAYLASWVKVSGQSDDFSGGISLDEKQFILAGSGGTIKITDDGGSTFTSGVFGVSTQINGIAWNRAIGGSSKLIAVGESGMIRTSTNNGSTWSSVSPAGGYSSAFNSCTFLGSYALVAGANGEVQRSTNGGVIFAKMTIANSYTGTINCIRMTSNGRAIFVGNAGEIQTSSDFGENWTKRSQANAYSGNFYTCCISDDGYAIVAGANGEIQISSDFGSTWTKVSPDNSYSGTFYGSDIHDSVAILVGETGEIQSSYNKGTTWVKRPVAAAETGTFKVAVLDKNNYSLIAGTGGILQKTFRLEGQVGESYTVPEGSDLLVTNSVYWWRLRYSDAAGFWSEWSNRTAFATALTFNYVNQPQNLAPANGSINISITPLLQSSVFSYLGASDTHSKSIWQISDSEDFSNLVYDSGEISDLVTHTVPSTANLQPSTKYYWKVMHKGTSGRLSPWSVATSFTAQGIPNTPTITSPANNATSVDQKPTITSSAFSSPVPSEVHSKSQWQVSTSSNFTSTVYDSGESNSKTSITLSSDLSLNTVYYVRVRHKGLNTGWSSWSLGNKFTTRNVASAPTIVSPTNGTSFYINESLTITGSAFSSSGETHNGSQLQVSKTNNFTNIQYDTGTISATTSFTVASNTLNSTGSYYVRIRYRGTSGLWSDWSGSITLQALAVANTPSIVSPTNGQTIGLPANIQVSEFNSSVSGDTWQSTKIQVSTNNTFNAIVYESGETQTNEFTVSLVNSTTYYVRAYQKGSITGQTSWSSTISFTTSIPSGSQLFTSNGTFTVPAGLTSIGAMAVGSGADATNSAGGGGGGLSYNDSIPVVGGQVLTITIEGAGSNKATILSRSGTTLLKAAAANGSVGGSSSSGLGTVRNQGGNGGSYRATNYGGGGGASGRFTTNGGAGSGWTTSEQQNWVPKTISWGSTVNNGSYTSSDWAILQSAYPLPYSGYFPPSGWMSYASYSPTYPFTSGSSSPIVWEGVISSDFDGQKGQCWFYASTKLNGKVHPTYPSTMTGYDLTVTGYYKKQVKSGGYYETVTVYSSTSPTGSSGQGRGGTAGNKGEGINLTTNKSNSAGNYGAGGGWSSSGSNKTGQSGALLLYW